MLLMLMDMSDTLIPWSNVRGIPFRKTIQNLYPEWRNDWYKYKLYATGPVDAISVGNALHLLYRMDTNQQRGHYV